METQRIFMCLECNYNLVDVILTISVSDTADQTLSKDFYTTLHYTTLHYTIYSTIFRMGGHYRLSVLPSFKRYAILILSLIFCRLKFILCSITAATVLIERDFFTRVLAIGGGGVNSSFLRKCDFYGNIY
uniref:Uncharacterized protein n=1 Tax=Glossina brevipalpis TaxID=37001 RepID=A0A1A9W2A5_9MUSC